MFPKKTIRNIYTSPVYRGYHQVHIVEVDAYCALRLIQNFYLDNKAPSRAVLDDRPESIRCIPQCKIHAYHPVRDIYTRVDIATSKRLIPKEEIAVGVHLKPAYIQRIPAGIGHSFNSAYLGEIGCPHQVGKVYTVDINRHALECSPILELHAERVLAGGVKIGRQVCSG